MPEMPTLKLTSPWFEKCAALLHPGVTYNPMLNQTFCRCGAVRYPGITESAYLHIKCCGGPLS